MARREDMATCSGKLIEWRTLPAHGNILAACRHVRTRYRPAADGPVIRPDLLLLSHMASTSSQVPTHTCSCLLSGLPTAQRKSGHAGHLRACVRERDAKEDNWTRHYCVGSWDHDMEPWRRVASRKYGRTCVTMHGGSPRYRAPA